MPKKLKLGTSVTWDNTAESGGWGSSSAVGGQMSEWGGWNEPAPDMGEDTFPTLGETKRPAKTQPRPAKAAYKPANFADLIYSEPKRSKTENNVTQRPSKPLRPPSTTMNFTPAPTLPVPKASKPPTPPVNISPPLRPPTYTLPTPSRPPNYTLPTPSPREDAKESALCTKAIAIIEDLHLQLASITDRSRLRYVIQNGSIRVEQIQ